MEVKLTTYTKFFSLNSFNSNHVDIIRNPMNSSNNVNAVTDRYCTYLRWSSIGDGCTLSFSFSVEDVGHYKLT